MKKVTPVIILIFVSLCGSAQNHITRIAFGSCSEEDTKEQMWADIVAQKPELWIWLGDNVYADTHDMSVLRGQYEKQKSNPDYQQLMKTCPIIGTWDDHDYGINDSGKYYSKKKDSKEELLRFLNVPAEAPVRHHEGVYSSYTYGEKKQKVKVILLDTRYFRDTVYRSTVPGKRYDINKTGDLLGEEQWKWLENELKTSDAAVNIIGSSIQFISNDHGYEKWGNFPVSRERFIKLLSTIKPKNTFIISGDRHIAEVSKMKVPGLSYELYDFTSSGLTHTWSDLTMRKELNQNRVGDLIIQKTFGLLEIDWTGKQPKVNLQIRGYKNALYEKQVIAFSPVR